MYAYSHGGNVAFERGAEELLDLSANINPLGIPAGVREAIVEAIPNCDRYPDSFSGALREQIGLFEGVNPGWIFCGNGASDVIFRIPRAVGAKRVLLTAPTFSDYERSARSFGAEVIHHTLLAEREFTLDGGFVQAIQKRKPDLVFVCNPNNPTGKLVKPELMQDILHACKEVGAWLVVDECFLDFAEQAEAYTSRHMLATYENLIILKAFTKLFTLPGIRLGYALSSNQGLIEQLYFHGADWPISNLAQAAGIAALQGAEGFIKQTVALVTKARKRVEGELEGLGFRVFEGAANYVFFQHPHPFDLREALDRKGIRIRACGNYPGLDESYYRIAVSTEAHNQIAHKALTELMSSYTKKGDVLS